MKSYVSLEIPKRWSSKHVKSWYNSCSVKKMFDQKKFIEIPSG